MIKGIIGTRIFLFCVYVSPLDVGENRLTVHCNGQIHKYSMLSGGISVYRSLLQYFLLIL